METTHEQIEHPGIIEKTQGSRVWVSIMPQSACGSCHSKSYCGMAEVSEKIVEVQPDSRHSYVPGQEVTIALKKSLGYKALFLGYLLPFLLILATLMVSLAITNNEVWAAFISITITIPYYTVLYMKRKNIKNSFRFYIKTNQTKNLDC